MFVLKMMKAMRVAKGTRQIDEIHERVLKCMQIVGVKVKRKTLGQNLMGFRVSGAENNSREPCEASGGRACQVGESQRGDERETR